MNEQEAQEEHQRAELVTQKRVVELELVQEKNKKLVKKDGKQLRKTIPPRFDKNAKQKLAKVDQRIKQLPANSATESEAKLPNKIE